MQDRKMNLGGSKTHPLWYANVGREAKEETVAKDARSRSHSSGTGEAALTASGPSRTPAGSPPPRLTARAAAQNNVTHPLGCADVGREARKKL